MIPTPDQVVPLLLPVVPDLRDALRAGIDHADGVQPDPDARDLWYWSHSARWRARNVLRATETEAWKLVPEVPNCGIHLRIDKFHLARVLRSLDGNMPHPGFGKRRNNAWVGVQGQFALAEGGLPPLSLILDWHEFDGEPEIHVGLPAAPWKYLTAPRLHWRVPLPEGGVDLNDLRFDPGDNEPESLVKLAIDPTEDRQARG